MFLYVYMNTKNNKYIEIKGTQGTAGTEKPETLENTRFAGVPCAFCYKGLTKDRMMKGVQYDTKGIFDNNQKKG